jgi:hypothetical protein
LSQFSLPHFVWFEFVTNSKKTLTPHTHPFVRGHILWKLPKHYGRGFWVICEEGPISGRSRVCVRVSWYGWCYGVGEVQGRPPPPRPTTGAVSQDLAPFVGWTTHDLSPHPRGDKSGPVPSKTLLSTESTLQKFMILVVFCGVWGGVVVRELLPPEQQSAPHKISSTTHPKTETRSPDPTAVPLAAHSPIGRSNSSTVRRILLWNN